MESHYREVNLKQALLALSFTFLLIGCASHPWEVATKGAAPVTSTECRFMGGTEEQCQFLPEYGFGDWGIGDAVAQSRTPGQ